MDDLEKSSKVIRLGVSSKTSWARTQNAEQVNMYKFSISVLLPHPPSFFLSLIHMHNSDFLLLLYVFCQPNLCSNPHTTARQTGPPK